MLVFVVYNAYQHSTKKPHYPHGQQGLIIKKYFEIMKSRVQRYE